MHNLESDLLSTDKTPTLKLLLNLRDRTLFDKALKDLCAHIQDVNDREDWRCSQLIDQDISEHHSNIWFIWTTVANPLQKDSRLNLSSLDLALSVTLPTRANFIEMDVYDFG